MANKKVLKKVVTVISTILVIHLVSACAGAGDWTSEPLPGGYVVMRVNSENISLCMPSGESLAEIIIEPYVTKVAYNDDYILVQRKDLVPEITSFKDLKKLFKRYYYFVEVDTQKVLGPYSKEKFEEKALELKVDDISWKRVKSLEKQDE
ncbi:hypothetical protein M2140_000376 [Clostridiales Family XIII bacterium PM5-7]